jgi:hypothetical protein
MNGDLTTSKYENLSSQLIYHDLTMSFRIAVPKSHGNGNPTPSPVKIATAFSASPVCSCCPVRFEGVLKWNSSERGSNYW